MKVAIIGRTEMLYDSARLLHAAGETVCCVVTARAAPESSRSEEDFRQMATEWGVPFVSSARITEHAELLSGCGADVAISVNYSGVIPSVITDLFPLGILNAHGGDLPRYRGNACQAWAILNGEDRIGLCIHRMVGGELDSGDIIARDYLPLTLATKITEVHSWMQQRVPHLFAGALRRLAADPRYVLEVQSKAPSAALRCYPRRAEDGRISWQQSAVQVLRLINACNKPYAGAFCELEGERVIIWDAELGPAQNYLAIPGQWAGWAGDHVDVATGDGLLRIRTIESDGVVGPPRAFAQSLRSRFS